LVVARLCGRGGGAGPQPASCWPPLPRPPAPHHTAMRHGLVPPRPPPPAAFGCPLQSALVLSIPRRAMSDETQETLRTSTFPSGGDRNTARRRPVPLPACLRMCNRVRGTLTLRCPGFRWLPCLLLYLLPAPARLYLPPAALPCRACEGEVGQGSLHSRHSVRPDSHLRANQT
jgi:hypothetical protein